MFIRNIKRFPIFIKRSFAMESKEKQVAVGDRKINFLKIGEGPRVVLCLPGVLGTIWTDFNRQVEHLNKSQLTLVCMDMPGCGGSRPPDCTFPSSFYHMNAEYAANLMKKLDLPRYSIMGWSDGGISGLILASQYPENVASLVVWGANAHVTSNDVKLYEGIQDIDNWSPKMAEPFLAVYGREVLKKGMHEWYDRICQIQKEGGDICKNDLAKIKAPTLIVHGDKDPVVPLEHAEFLKEKISNSTLVRFPNGKHNLHLRFYEEFNNLVENFFKEH
ncbi:valacyclovir hydrolase isoform X1 [Rhodnius prolixus]|uniref:valacyclovir hydrolase isoform X1 n=1 Tax=Rhodnius prolixus TaxID=13249 RepID=UPI003D18C4DE